MKKYNNKTLNKREVNYGAFEDNAQVSQDLKYVISTGRNYSDLTVVQRESLEMICTKISRILGGDPNYTDNWHDIAGYANLVEKDISNNKEIK